MKQKAFTPIFAENLRSNVSENIAKYNNIGVVFCDKFCKASKAPIITIPEIAFVTLINGECRVGVTRQIEK